MSIVLGDGASGEGVVTVYLGDGAGGTLLTQVVLGDGGAGIPIWPAAGPVPPAPTVSSNPSNLTVITTQTATFTAGFNYSGTLTYQWEASVNSGASWFSLGAPYTSTTLSFTAALGDSGNQYRCVATDEYNRTATTSGATITVTNPPAGSQTFNSSGTFTVPAGVTSVRVSAVGGGGGGGSGVSSQRYGESGNFRSYATGGGGGAAGEQVIGRTYSVTPGQTISVTIGNGGAGGSSTVGQGVNRIYAGLDGANGQNTVIGSPINLTMRGGQLGKGGGRWQAVGAPDWAWTTRAEGGAGYASSGSSNGANGGGDSGNGGSVSSSDRTRGTDEVKRSSTPASGRPGGNWLDRSNVQTSTGGGNGGSSQFGTGGLAGPGAEGLEPSRQYGDAGNGGVGCGGGGGGGNSMLNYLNARGGFGGSGGKGRVVFSWG